MRAASCIDILHEPFQGWYPGQSSLLTGKNRPWGFLTKEGAKAVYRNGSRAISHSAPGACPRQRAGTGENRMAVSLQHQLPSTAHCGGFSNLNNHNLPTIMQSSSTSTTDQNRDLNRDPLTGEPGSHPVGTGLGAAGGAATGAAIGSVGGPIGTAVGGVIGAIAGGLAGKGVAEAVDPTAEDAYWRENYNNESYIDRDSSYDDYEPAYRAGYTNYASREGRSYDEVEDNIGRTWDQVKGNSRLGWEKAKHATRAAWDRVERAIPGDSDRDGK